GRVVWADVTRPTRHGGYNESMSSVPSSRALRRRFLSNLPTLVLGTSSTKVQCSGNCHLASLSERYSRNCPAVTSDPSLRTTATSGRSSHFSSGIPMTAASATSSWAITWFSRSTEEIHSPPDLMTSFARSVSVRKPSLVMCPTSPVRSQPLWNLSGSTSLPP